MSGRSQLRWVLAPGETEGELDNRHQGSDQWIYVVDGEGVAVVNGHRHKLRPGVVLLIEKGESHEIRAAATKLKTLSFYVPPAYRDEDKPLPAGKP